jgi:hypothetical protein
MSTGNLNFNTTGTGNSCGNGTVSPACGAMGFVPINFGFPGPGAH